MNLSDEQIIDCFKLVIVEGNQREYMIAVGRRILAAASPPAGWKLVPIDPTPEMVLAGETTFRYYALGLHMNGAIPTFEAMVAAAPAAPEAGPNPSVHPSTTSTKFPDAASVEIRRNDDGTLDEVVGTGHLHVEQMSATHWWLALTYGEGRRVTVSFHSKAKIKAYVDDEGTIPAGSGNGSSL